MRERDTPCTDPPALGRVHAVSNPHTSAPVRTPDTLRNVAFGLEEGGYALQLGEADGEPLSPLPRRTAETVPVTGTRVGASDSEAASDAETTIPAATSHRSTR